MNWLRATPEVKVVEVGPRDGLQNESELIPGEVKQRFIAALADAGFSEIEATSFVSPRWVPQLADAAEISASLQPRDGLIYTALVPNEKGLDLALAAGYRRVAVFTAASEAFCQKNTNRSIAESLRDFGPLIERARRSGAGVRGYVSTAWYCPFSGRVDRDNVRRVTHELLALGVDEVSLGDTVGLAVPTEVDEVLDVVLNDALGMIALHFHDTSGTALANVLAGLRNGVMTYDASAGGLGGCPYAPGATGNLATEDLLYMLHGMGIKTGVNLERVARASLELAGHLGRTLPSRTLARMKRTLQAS